MADGASDQERSGGADFVTLRVGERGRRFATLVLEALDQGSISQSQASRYLAVQPRHLEAVRDRVGTGTVDA
jgi:hypothetical protein